MRIIFIIAILICAIIIGIFISRRTADLDSSAIQSNPNSTTEVRASFLDKIKTWPFYVLPQHFISRIVFYLTRIESPHAVTAMKWFSSHFGIDMSEAAQSDFKTYPSFNAFFTRALKAGSRPIANGEKVIASPVDGTVSQFGKIQDGRIFQAKGQDYSLLELVGGYPDIAKHFTNGQFATIYLSPKDYHRIHMPLDGQLTQMVHVPGRLFSVAPFTVRALPRLFARNERVVTLFETPAGPMAMILVGAINVAAIETVWAGLVTPPAGQAIKRWDYNDDNRINLNKGDEMGRFNMGSTVILLFPDSMTWGSTISPEKTLQMGEEIAQLISQ